MIAELAASAETPRTRLAFLDGLRGLAALYVVLSHCWVAVAWPDISGGRLSPGLRFWSSWLAYGHFSVSVFIVLSGYCLMLPVARSGGILPGGLAGFWRRRTRRILPAYYAALLVPLALVALIPALRHPGDTWWGLTQPAFAPGALLSHALLLHNLNPAWIFKINGPAWSMATEWQIYFVFALLLLPIRRRLGMGIAVAVALALGFLPRLLLGAQLDGACPWFLGLFALGMAAAEWSENQADQPARLRGVWLPLAVACGLDCAVLLSAAPRWVDAHVWYVDVLAGLGTAALILACRANRPPARLFELRPMVWLGEISYSLYLVHSFLLATLYLAIHRAGLRPAFELATLLTLGFPASVGFAWLFHLAFERPFLSHRRSAGKRVAVAAGHSALAEERG